MSESDIEVEHRPRFKRASSIDEREASIERLERALSDEREQSAALAKTIDELRFQMDILERSYSKQLADARQRADAAERDAADLRARLTEVETAHEEAVRRSGKSPPRDEHLTINELIDGAAWSQDRRPAGFGDDVVAAEQDSAPEEMLAPELVFTNERDEGKS